MRYVERLLQDSEYVILVKKLEQAEAGREFCRHGLPHFLDVARLAWIMSLEQAIEEQIVPKEGKKEQIYLTALLHDLGRLEEMEKGIPHHQAGEKLAEHFLEKIGLPLERRQEILEAVQNHRGDKKVRNDFINLIKKADHSSRNCFFCDAQPACNWSRERRNKTLVY